jgi:hypothetical protein
MNINLSKTQYIIAFVVVGILGFIFYDIVSEYILGIFGLGTAAAIGLQQKSKQQKAVADEHITMADHDINMAVELQKEADIKHEALKDLARGIHGRDEPPAPGKKRKTFKMG